MNLNNAALNALGPAKSSMEVLAQKKQQFDLIFIDADKPSYTTYYKVHVNHIHYFTKDNIIIKDHFILKWIFITV